jgi:putative ABC transport system permease protein
MSFRVDVVEGARIAVFSLGANRLRTLLTTAGIGIGVATLARMLSSMGSNALFVGKMKWGGGSNEWWESRNRKDLTVAHAQAIREQSQFVTAVAPAGNTRVTLAYLGNELPMVQVTGTTEEYLGVSGYELSTGRFLIDMDDADRKSVVVLGADVAETLFHRMNPLGATLLVDGHPFRVIGTLQRKGKMLDFDPDRAVIMPLRTMQTFFGKARWFQIVVGVESQEVMKRAEAELVGILRRARQTPPDAPDDFVINKPEQMMDLYRKLTGALYSVVAGIGFITLLVGGIGIMNIMLVAVRERTREIGVRRALGARKRTIVIQFLMEAAAVSAAGGTLGTAVGLSAAKIVSEITPLAATVQLSTIVFGISFAAAVGLLFGIWPAARAASLDPVEALRYE